MTRYTVDSDLVASAASGGFVTASPQPTAPSSVSIRASVMQRNLPPSCGSG